jgi:elongation factor P--(R)-beta-lysine ligase
MTMNWRPAASIEALKQRAKLLHDVRLFFKERDVLEVETPALSRFPTLDLHLDSFCTSPGTDLPQRYLITSPEYHMKRLIAAGSGSIYQICKAFRCDEVGSNHNPEFSMLEWYRVGWDHLQLMSEIEDLMTRLMGTGKALRVSYQEIFQSLLGIDPLELTTNDFLDICRDKRIDPPQDLKAGTACRDEQLNFLMGVLIEPRLGKEQPVFICDYPASQASLSRLSETNPSLSTRFEVFYQGLELGNGFYELTDAEVQEKRFRETNASREKMGKNHLAMDDGFLSALKAGMPDCAGVAMGLDRMMMLAMGEKDIASIMTFSWNHS